MEAQLVKELPDANGWQFEPKWDGFRGVLENDGSELELWSRNGRPLLRYFPELRPLGDLLPPHSALDGEIVIARDGVLDFDSMQMRLHPAESRVRRLAAEIPAEFVVFDLLLWDGDPVHELPLEERRAELERVGGGFRLSPTTADTGEAQEWLDSFEAAGLDGVIAKRLGLPYLPGSREGVQKVKPHKTADCVIVGVRWKEKPTRLATLLLGLYDENGVLHHPGVVGSFPAARRRELATEMAELITDGPHPWLGDALVEGQRLPGGITRWRSTEQPWVPLRPERVVEVSYEHTEGGYPGRFRHTAQFVRWRPDREPSSCDYAQLDEPARYDLDAVFKGEVPT